MRFGGLIAAIVFAAIAAIVVLRMSAGNQAAPATAPQAVQTATVSVYVAARPITVGTTLTADMVATQPWPEHLALEGFVVADGKSNVVGMVARGAFQQSEPLLKAKLANPNDPNFLSGELPKGQRVITIAVNETDGVAGFVFPGDHVDLIYTHEVDAWDYAPAAAVGAPSTAQKVKQTVTETLLTNVKVLAIDQRSSSAGAVDKNGSLVIPRTASLMVSQADAQRVRLASKTGVVSLALRALADKESSDTLLLTGPRDVSQAATDDGAPAALEGGVKIVRGAPTGQKEEAASATVARGAPTGSAAANADVVNPALVGTP
ncbi:MAG: Flp pilus assembly protein CpaB [Alphaproteobacteria bacterium]|nr:Flp pilus assembly protein CpaB [Alphaproteobacteria bacterium]